MSEEDKKIKKAMNELLKAMAKDTPCAKVLLFVQKVENINRLIMDEILHKKDNEIAEKFTNFYEQQEEIIKKLAIEFFGEEILNRLEE